MPADPKAVFNDVPSARAGKAAVDRMVQHPDGTDTPTTGRLAASRFA